MKQSILSKRRRAAADEQPLAEMPESAVARSSDEKAQPGAARAKVHAPDGLARHQRNPLAPPINITSNG